jgi:betaine-aldehyde dehydrogenase
MSSTFRNYIDGAFADAAGGRTLDVVDPHHR